MTCPICGNQAEKRGDRDYGDKKRYDCPRCGPFEISGTALSMLDGRLSAESNARARLSHAVRLEPKKGPQRVQVPPSAPFFAKGEKSPGVIRHI